MGDITSQLPLVAAVGIFVAVVIVVFVAFRAADDRAASRGSFKMLEDYDNDIVKKLREVRKRETVSLSEQLVKLGNKVTPQGRVAATRHKLAIAGRPTKDDVDRYFAMRILFAIGAVVWVVLILFLFPVFHGMLRMGVAGFGGVALVMYPDIWVNRLKEARQKAISRALPDVLDILTISVEAGLGFEQAVDQVVTAIPGPLSDEFFRMLGEVRAGANRGDAMRAIDERTEIPELKSFIMSVTQADQFGVSIGGILRAQAQELRIKRRQLAQEKAQKLPVKMLLPMVFCIFPALLVIILGPAMINTFRNFKV